MTNFIPCIVISETTYLTSETTLVMRDLGNNKARK